jgi:hypothetical protein
MFGGPGLFWDHLAVFGWGEASSVDRGLALSKGVDSHRRSLAAACDGLMETVASTLSFSKRNVKLSDFHPLSLCLPVNE